MKPLILDTRWASGLYARGEYSILEEVALTYTGICRCAVRMTRILQFQIPFVRPRILVARDISPRAAGDTRQKSA